MASMVRLTASQQRMAKLADQILVERMQCQARLEPKIKRLVAELAELRKADPSGWFLVGKMHLGHCWPEEL